MDFDGYNLSTQRLDDVLAEVEKRLDVQLVESTKTAGTSRTTVGFRTATDTWVRIAWRSTTGDIHGQSWTGAELASAIPGVKMPELFRSYRWKDTTRSVVWRADEYELVRSRALHPTGVLDSEPAVHDGWWSSLRSSLTSLASVGTDRVGMAQAHLDRRIRQVFEGVNTKVDEWTTAHADLHFGNLTAPDCYLLDWESWGRAPRGLDAATLWGHSLCVPAVAERIQLEFTDDLNSRSGLLSQLIFCANVIRLNSTKPNPSPLLEPARKESGKLLMSLRAA